MWSVFCQMDGGERRDGRMERVEFFEKPEFGQIGRSSLFFWNAQGGPEILQKTLKTSS